MNRNLAMLKHALDMWKRGQIEEDAMLLEQGQKAIAFWRDMEAAAQYSAKITSEGTK